MLTAINVNWPAVWAAGAVLLLGILACIMLAAHK